jgi:uncharacterized protein (TIGR03083 family)
VPALTREQAVAILNDGSTAVESRLAGLSDEEMARPGPDGGWSAKDVLAHLAFWEEVALLAIDEIREGRPLTVGPIFAEGGVDAANAKNHRESAAMPLADVRGRSSAAHERLTGTILAMSEDEWRSKTTGADGRVRPLHELLGSILGAPKRPFGHAFAHLDE